MGAQRKFRVIVAGAGIAGLFMAEKLKRAGIDFIIYEKAGEVGGTWRDNTYPGLFVDVLSRQYEFPFQPNYDWSRKYAPAPEIQAYIKKVADDRGLRKYIRFNQEIAGARFAGGRWEIETTSGERDVADVFIAATGFLNKPTYPKIEGRDNSPARPSIPRAGIIRCRTRAKAGASSDRAAAGFRSPRRWPGRARRSPSSSAARSGFTSARTRNPPGCSGCGSGCRPSIGASRRGCGNSSM